MAGQSIDRKLNIYINDKEVVNSLGGITGAMAKTRNEIKNLNAGTDDYDENLKRLKDTYSQLSKAQTKFKDEISETPVILKKIKEGLGPVATGMIAAFSIGSIIGGTLAALDNAKKLIFDFEQGVADLSAITGATGKNLDYLKNSAIELGESTKGGAVAVLEAYKLIASAKPELLDNVQALNQVTEATLLLAKASGMEMPAAATALTDAMNQFGVDASKASVFVDALANGAKYGAAEIPQITEALLKFGAVARSSNVDIKQSTALVELLAENGLKGADAGTALRNVLLKISAPDALPKEAIDVFSKLGISMAFLKDKTIPFQEKLEALKPLLVDNANVVKVFGLENTTAALNVISHTERLKELASKMGEVGTAEEQAALRMDTVNNKSELLKSKYDSLILSIGSGSGVVSGFFKFFIDGASDALTGLIRLNTSWDQLQGKARQNGTSEGKKSFDRRMAIGINQGGNEADIAKNIKTSALADYKNYAAELKVIDEDIQANESRGFFDKKTDSYIARQQKKKEVLLKDINIQATLVREANKKLFDLENPKTPPITAPSGLTDAEKSAAEAAAKKENLAIARAKKHSEDLLKQENDLQKQLIESRSKADDLKNGLIKDDYAREKALIDSEYDKKIEDLQLNLKKEQEAIDKLKNGIVNPKTSQEDVTSFKKQLADRLEIQANYNATLISTNQTRDFKLGALQEKYLDKSFQKEQEEHNKSITLLKTKQNNELVGITTLEQAKAILKGKVSDKELREITTLEEAKKAINEKNLKEEYDLEIKNLEDIVTKYNEAVNNSGTEGFTLLTDDEKDKFNKAIDDAKLKISGLKVSKNNTDTKPEKSQNTGVDILGTDTGEWANKFKDLDTFDGKMTAAKQSVGALQNAFGMYFKFTEAGDARALQSFTNATNKKKAALSDQLAKGFISQEVYNARNEKLDADLAKKKAEIEYKQAKREKIMSAASVLTNTAMSIMNIWGHSPDPTGISQGVLTAIVSALGAAQLGIVLAQPLPSKNGFYDGGYTGSGNERSSPGPVHYDEYVVPKKVLFGNDPVVPNIISYLEAKRTGKHPANQDVSSSLSTTNQSSAGSTQDNSETLLLLSRAIDVLDKLEKDGFHGWIVNDIPTAKKIRDKIKELTNLESNAKL